MRWPQIKIKNKKTAIFLVCLGISAFFWLLIKLSKEYEISVELPIKYSNYPQDKILINKPDSVILLKFTDNGFDLIPYSIFGSFSRLDIDVQQLNRRKNQNSVSSYHIRTDLLSERINKMMSSKNYISIIRPDSLVVKMEELFEKKLPVSANLEYSLSPQFQLKKNIYYLPDSISIFGRKNILDEISALNTEEVSYINLNENISEILKLELPPYTNSNIKEVELHIEVEKFTESNLQIPIKNYFSPTENLKLFPDKLNIKYAVSFEKYKDVNSTDFKINITKDSISEGRLHISLQEYPNYIRIIDYHPKIAEYIIIK